MSSVTYMKLNRGAPIKKQETAYGRHLNLTLYSHPPPSVSDPGFLFLSPGICFSLMPCLSLALLLPSSVSRHYISLSLHLSVFLSIPLDLSIISLSPFSFLLRYSVVSARCRRREKQRVMCLRQKRSSALPLSHE